MVLRRGRNNCTCSQVNQSEKTVNKTDEAAAAAAAKPAYVEAIYMSGLCNEKLGSKELALKDFSAALKLNPEFELAKIAYQRLGGKP